MIIRENKNIDQFPTPKHQQIWLPFLQLLAKFNVIFGTNTTRDTENCFKIHSPLTARDREITSDNFEISPQIMPLLIQIPYKVPIYECTSVVFVHVQEKMLPC